jgi:hypothetical protein
LLCPFLLQKSGEDHIDDLPWRGTVTAGCR